MTAILLDICWTPVVPDGLVFDENSITVTDIRELEEYGGRRIKLYANLAQARIPLQIDVVFGDVVTPEAKIRPFPSMLDSPAPKIRMYPKESVIAEKLQAMVYLGIANSRMKDFYDLYVLGKWFAYEGQLFVRAIYNTFTRRQTTLPVVPPMVFTDEFASDKNKKKQWQGFLHKSNLDAVPQHFIDVTIYLKKFLWSPLQAAASDHEFNKKWKHGTIWS